MDFVYEHYKNSDLSLLNKLTLVIPTYNRNYYLSRCLWYHAHFPFGQIIVADSSYKKKKNINRKTVSMISNIFNIDIKYLQYQPETDRWGRDIYNKWSNAIYHVDTEYSQICTDKEFIIPTTFCKCIDFLDNNPDYNTADGMHYRLEYNEDDNSTQYSVWTPDDCTYNQSNPIDRFNASTSQTENPLSRWNLLLAIRRSDFHKYIYYLLSKYSLNYLTPFGDFTPQLISILCSKRMHFSNMAYNCRDLSVLKSSNNKNKSESSALRYSQNCKISDYIQEGIYYESVNSVSNCIDECLSYYYSKQYIDSIKLEILDKYLNEIRFIYNPRDPIQRIIYSNHILSEFWNNAPIIIKKLIGYLYGYSIAKSDYINIESCSLPEIDIINQIIKKSISCAINDRIISID